SPYTTLFRSFELSGTQPLDRMGAAVRCPTAPSQQVEGQRRGDQGVAVRGRPDSGDEEVGTGVLEQETAGTSVECGIDVFLVIEGRDHDDLRVRRDLGRSEEHTSELQSRFELVCRLLRENTNDR